MLNNILMSSRVKKSTSYAMQARADAVAHYRKASFANLHFKQLAVLLAIRTKFHNLFQCNSHVVTWFGNGRLTATVHKIPLTAILSSWWSSAKIQVKYIFGFKASFDSVTMNAVVIRFIEVRVIINDFIYRCVTSKKMGIRSSTESLSCYRFAKALDRKKKTI